MAVVTIAVQGEILDLDNSTPAMGMVTFRTLTELRDTVANIVYEPATYTATLDGSGRFTLNLPATDSPDVTPSGWLYQVHISTTTWRSTFYVSLPASLAPTVDFADLVAAIPDGSGIRGDAYAPISLVAQVEALEQEIQGLVFSVNGRTGTVLLDAAAVGADVAGAAATVQTTLTGLINNINASQITSGTLDYRRLGGTIAENLTVAFGRATLVVPGTASDVWQWQYNGTRVTYVNEYACLRVRGVPDFQVPARVMCHSSREGTSLGLFQVSLNDASTHLFQVLANGDIQGPGGLSMLPTAPVAVTFTAPAASATLISDGVSTGAPYAVTTTLHAAANRVYLDGAVANPSGVSIAGGTVLFTVTAAHRPTSWVQFNERTSTTLSARVTVRPDGTVRLDQALAPAATVSFDGLNWRKS